MLLLIISAFAAGVLTVLSPCVLPLLPIIVGGSLTGHPGDRRRPLIIAASLAAALLLFTLALKATTVFINVPPWLINFVSGLIIVCVGLAILFPVIYAVAISKLGFGQKAEQWLGTGAKKRGIIGPVIIGAALGPVFTSCSPVYAYILATVLPANFGSAVLGIVAYVVGLSLILLLIGFLGQRLTSKLRFVTNPSGLFQRTLAVIFIIVGLGVMTGLGTKFQVWVANYSPFQVDSLSAGLLPKTGHTSNSTLYSVSPYQAPELTGIQGWVNSKPLTLASLKGKVVLVDFWTYTCINCLRTLPYVEGWYQEYAADGLVVIGVEAPEFSYEKVPSNVEAAARQDGIKYPIAIDGDLATWNAFSNQYWPAEYLIDRQGNVRRTHFGEGDYAQSEQAIRGLLAEGLGAKVPQNMVVGGNVTVPITSGQTPETYLGTDRADAYDGTPDLGSSPDSSYNFSSKLLPNQWSLSGHWHVTGSGITAGDGAKIKINVAAKDVYLVAGSPTQASVQVKLNGTPISSTGAAGPDVSGSAVQIQLPNLYRVAGFKQFSTGTLELDVPPGVTLNTFTFGS